MAGDIFGGKETAPPPHPSKPPVPSLSDEDAVTLLREKQKDNKIKYVKGDAPDASVLSKGKSKTPVINNDGARKWFLMNNDKAKFEITRDKNVDKAREAAINTFKNDKLARKTVLENNDIIEEMAAKHGTDPDLIRAVMYAENARGDNGGLNRLADIIGKSKSQRPMNIRGDIWRPILGKEAEPLNDPRENIEAGAILLKRIGDRIEEPDAAKIGSIWNFTGRETTSDFGEAIGRVYDTKPWEIKEQKKK